MHAPPSPLVERLKAGDQEHVLRFWDDLDAAQRRALVADLESIDLDEIARLAASASSSDESDFSVVAPPAGLVSLPRSEKDRIERAEAAQRGNELLSAGKIGIILVAGGQGTRLGFPHPKGMFPIGPVSGASLFAVLAGQAVARSRRAQAPIPYCVMTSDSTHDETVSFFAEHEFFGLPREDVAFFRQGNMPAVDARTGRLLLAGKGTLSVSPDGHGGMLAALRRAGLLDELRRRGVEHLYYHQVDNPAAVVCDPVFLGFHVLRGSEVSTKVVSKRSAEERMGVVVEIDGRTRIVEYSDLSAGVARQRDASGELRIRAGNTAIHVFDLRFLERLASEGHELPFHVAHKQISCLDDSGKFVGPDRPNAYKFERFIFDVLPRAERTLVLEADRDREFHPVKNATGDDSPQSAQAALSRLFRDWLREAGCIVPDDVPVEIDPQFALDAAELRSKLSPGTRFDGPVHLAE